MFFLKKKTKVTHKDKEFDIFNNKINHIGYGADRKFSERNYEEPYLWTSNLTACIGVGLIYREDNNSKIELYHSVSEHYLENIEIEDALASGTEFVTMLFNFLKQLTETRGLIIYIAFDPIHNNIPDRDRTLICNGVNQCIKYINQSQSKSLKLITHAQVKAIEADAGTFFITATGRVGTIVEALADSLDKIKKLFAAENNLGNSELYKEYITNLVSSDESDTFATKKATFEKLQELASAFLSKKHSSKKQALEKLAIKLVSWDLFLARPNSQLFKAWQNKHADIQYEPPSP
ncbi:hypothetical protein [Legionella cardiaca]|uniref:Dot/Icm T4SS effector n=1 Tax=Legionella cardiaca TaxID=1071983 RepID=A0ABY8APQ2_9GAMM|nr:hypothetical protein [Legionella cardiaca]WED42694.1 hypothetical protein PXX05_12420 [Legionella cardiaca]